MAQAPGITTATTRHVNSFILDICFMWPPRLVDSRGYFFHVALEHLAADDGGRRRSLVRRRRRLPRRSDRCGRFRVFDECGDLPVFGTADADAFPDAGSLVRASVATGLGVGHVDGVVPGDEDPARAAETGAIRRGSDHPGRRSGCGCSRDPRRTGAPRESIAIVCGSLISPRPEPFLPHSLMNVPSLVNRTTRLFLPFAVAVGDENIAVRRRRARSVG